MVVYHINEWCLCVYVRAHTMVENHNLQSDPFDEAVFPASPSCCGGDNENMAPARH